MAFTDSAPGGRDDAFGCFIAGNALRWEHAVSVLGFRGSSPGWSHGGISFFELSQFEHFQDAHFGKLDLLLRSIGVRLVSSRLRLSRVLRAGLSLRGAKKAGGLCHVVRNRKSSCDEEFQARAEMELLQTDVGTSSSLCGSPERLREDREVVGHVFGR